MKNLYLEYKKGVAAIIAAVGITVAVVAEVLQTRVVTELQLLTVVSAWGGVIAVIRARNVPQAAQDTEGQ